MTTRPFADAGAVDPVVPAVATSDALRRLAAPLQRAAAGAARRLGMVFAAPRAPSGTVQLDRAAAGEPAAVAEQTGADVAALALSQALSAPTPGGGGAAAARTVLLPDLTALHRLSSGGGVIPASAAEALPSVAGPCMPALPGEMTGMHADTAAAVEGSSGAARFMVAHGGSPFNGPLPSRHAAATAAPAPLLPPAVALPATRQPADVTAAALVPGFVAAPVSTPVPLPATASMNEEQPSAEPAWLVHPTRTAVAVAASGTRPASPVRPAAVAEPAVACDMHGNGRSAATEAAAPPTFGRPVTPAVARAVTPAFPSAVMPGIAPGGLRAAGGRRAGAPMQSTAQPRLVARQRDAPLEPSPPTRFVGGSAATPDAGASVLRAGVSSLALVAVPAAFATRLETAGARPLPAGADAARTAAGAAALAVAAVGAAEALPVARLAGLPSDIERRLERQLDRALAPLLARATQAADDALTASGARTGADGVPGGAGPVGGDGTPPAGADDAVAAPRISQTFNVRVAMGEAGSAGWRGEAAFGDALRRVALRHGVLP